MKTKNSRLMKIVGLLFVSVLILSMTIPATAAPIAERPMGVSGIPGTAVAADKFFVTTLPLAQLTAPVRVEDWPNPGPDPLPLKMTRGDFQIPRRTGNANSPSGFARSSDRANVLPPQKKLIDVPMPSLDAAWAGLNQGNNRAIFGYGVYPPDTNGAASDLYYIQTVNSTFTIWDLTTVSPNGVFPMNIYAPQKISTLWKNTNDGVCDVWDDGDPVVFFDEAKSVWVLTQFALPNYGVAGGPYFECIAVSQTANPLGSWNLYRYSFNVMNDYPKFGTWQDGYYMSINQFAPEAASAWRGQGVAVFERDVMSSANPAVAATARMIYIDTYPSCTTGAEPACVLGGMLPSDMEGAPAPVGAPNFFMQFDDDSWGYSPDQLQIWTFTTNWAAGTASFAPLAAVPVAPFDSEVCAGYARNCIPQPNTTVGVDAIADRLMYRLQFRNFAADTPALGQPAHFTLVVNHTVDANTDPALNNGYAGIRWYELQSTDSGATWGVHQYGDLAPDAKSRWMGSAAMDAMGNIAVGYSVSSSTYAPNMAYSGRLFTDPLNTLPRTEKVAVSTTTAAGSQLGLGYRWGDYSALDLAPDGCEFFFTSEYLRGSTAAEWYTSVAAFSNNSCWNADATAPNGTVINAMPTDPSNSASAHFAFSNAATDVAGFDCQLDGGAWADCTVGAVADYTNLGVGSHTFNVRAYDTSSNYEATPATYTWNVVALTANVKSSAAEDGWILESAPASLVGGPFSATGGYLLVGDNVQKRQFRSVVSFDTGAALTDGAVVLDASLYLRSGGAVGTVTGFGPLMTDIVTPSFGTAALAASDFEALSSLNNSTDAFASGVWYVAALKPAALPSVSSTALTQFRVKFARGSNGNTAADYLTFFSGESATLQPVLTITYLLP
ncbi:MAG: hypothetical protein PHQ36_01605 [Anaerolineales bacterium]|nr:hypothetical protein [Anaerolineales bacterium]